MKKEFEEISQLLDQRASQLNELRNKRLLEIREADKKYNELQKALDNAETADDFVRLKKELKEQEDQCRFLSSHKNREPKYNLTKAEFNEIEKKITKELEALRTEYAPKIAKALESVIELADQYSDQAEALEDLSNRASHLARGFGSNSWRLNMIAETVEDPLTYIHAFYRGYFPARGNVNIAKSALKYPFRAKGLNNEIGPIYQYLLSLKEAESGSDK